MAWRSPLVVLLGMAFATALPARSEELAAHPVVVELFTSQGCSSCPPADANLIEVSGRADVLALSFGVTYWDYLGWEDTFARKEFTQRQMVYERPLGHPGAFTPQIVVNGRRDVIGHDLGELQALIDAEAVLRGAEAPPPIQRDGDRLEIGAGAAPMLPADIWLVRYDPRITEVPVARGENRRRVLPIKNSVRELIRLGGWNGDAVALDLPPVPDGLASAVLVQLPLGGEILAAAKL
ncbi:MAG: DUF1223 domain-containing protein [Rhodospirillaceae bacterium]|nr:DUF1223 domain-containing protein [Rhodospirillaceae bacterium]